MAACKAPALIRGLAIQGAMSEAAALIVAPCAGFAGQPTCSPRLWRQPLKILESLAKLCAILAGVLMTIITVLSCVSIVGREFAAKTVPGDFELVGLATGAAVAFFMPLCQWHRGNIVVDFFTSKVPPTINAVLDRLGALLLALCFFLLAWRCGLGGLNSMQTNSSTMLLGFPESVVYFSMVPGFALTGVIALAQSALGFSAMSGEHA
jgi:TRAP-type C4-dicarboxylate transport system permease small subunit